jgi:hypothetical protein
MSSNTKVKGKATFVSCSELAMPATQRRTWHLLMIFVRARTDTPATMHRCGCILPNRRDRERRGDGRDI